MLRANNGFDFMTKTKLFFTHGQQHALHKYVQCGELAAHISVLFVGCFHRYLCVLFYYAVDRVNVGSSFPPVRPVGCKAID